MIRALRYRSSILLGSTIYVVSVGIQVMAVLGLVRFLQRQNRLGKFHENLWFSTRASLIIEGQTNRF